MSYLIHMNDAHWPAGTPGGVGGQFRPKFGRAKYVERGNYTYTQKYDTETGKLLPEDQWKTYTTTERLTPQGQARYRSEQLKNDAKARKNRMEEEAVSNVDRWVSDDYQNYSNLAKNAADLTRQGSSIAGKLFKDPPRGPRYDLSDMSDEELRRILNREEMEQKYNNYFNPQQVNKGREVVQSVLDGATTALTVAGGIASLALTIHQIRSGSGS